MNQSKRNLPRPGGTVILLSLLVLFVILSACGDNTVTTGPTKASGTAPNTTGVSGTTKAAGNVSPSVPPSATAATGASAPDAAGGEAAGGDEPLKSYVDPAGQFSFDYPQSWGNTTKPGETVRFTGRDEFISIAITNTTLSPLDFARADAAALTAASFNFKGEALKSNKVAGTTGAMESYTWQAGPSPVTGKMIASSARRYYIPGPGGKIAVFTYSSPTNVYDPAGADDFANSFKWLK